MGATFNKDQAMKHSEQINEVSAALSLAQAAMKPALKDANNPHFKSKYADLASVFEAIRTPLAQYGLAVLQDIGNADGAVTVCTRIVHKSGQWIEFGPFGIPADKQNAHGYGSAVTYCRRFALASAMGVSADDDDGNAAATYTAPKSAPAGSVGDPTQEKSAPGVSKARAWISGHMADLRDAGDPQAFLDAMLPQKAQWARICSTYPNLWVGPDGSGLRGEAMKMANIYEVRPQFDEFVKAVELAAASAGDK